MKARLLYLRLIVATLLAFAASCLWAQDGLKGALSQANFTARFERSLVIADLDGDQQPDGAILLQSGWPATSHNFRIQVHFTGHTNLEFAFQSTQTAIAINAWDIDHDGDIDLVVEEALTHKPLRVWINDGNGQFHEGRVQDFPSLAPGSQEQLQAPFSRAEYPPMCLTQQRGFETPILAASLLARPPSKNRSNAVHVISLVDLYPLRLHSSRAPPLL